MTVYYRGDWSARKVACWAPNHECDPVQAAAHQAQIAAEIEAGQIIKGQTVEPAPVKSEEGGINKKSTVAANSGAKGMASSPVKMTGDVAQGRPAPTAKDAIGRVGNTPAQSTQDPKPATKPQLGQAAGVNNKSPLPRQ